MNGRWCRTRAGIVLAVLVTAGGGTARAQSSLSGGSRSLGGYGGSMPAAASGMGMSGPVIPYAGQFGGFMPYRMGGGSLSFQSRGDVAHDVRPDVVQPVVDVRRDVVDVGRDGPGPGDRHSVRAARLPGRDGAGWRHVDDVGPSAAWG